MLAQRDPGAGGVDRLEVVVPARCGYPLDEGLDGCGIRPAPDGEEGVGRTMEGGSIGHVCYVNKVPFAILRSISDGDGGETDYQTFAEKAAHQSIEVVLEFIGRAEELK